MCSPALCSTCNKVTYAGCGNHKDQVLSGFPVEKRCQCR